MQKKLNESTKFFTQVLLKNPLLTLGVLLLLSLRTVFILDLIKVILTTTQNIAEKTVLGFGI